MWYFFSVLVFLSPTIVFSRTPCAPRDFGQGTIVCVCNATYCDDLGPIEKPADGTVAVYETTKDGLRFESGSLNWGDSNSTSKLKATINIDRKKKLQTIIGFGGAFTDSTGYVTKQLPQGLQDQIIIDFFSENGTEFSLSRLPIGGADFSTRPYTYDDGNDGDFSLTKWALQPEDINYKIPYMKKAKSVAKNPQKFFGSPWSAPGWMKTNNEIYHGGLLKGNPGGQYYKLFAQYFVKFLDAYKAQGLDIWGITIENEPRNGMKPGYLFNSMGFTPELQRDFIKLDLGPTLQAAGYGKGNLSVIICDDQRSTIPTWAQTIYSDAAATSYVDGSAFHWYANRADNIVNLDKTYDINPNKFILGTEACNAFDIGFVPKLGNWFNLEAFVRDIIIDLSHHVNGWVFWNMVLDLKGGPNWAGYGSDSPIIANPEKKEYYKQPDFYGLAHDTKFIGPESVRLDHTQSLNDSNLLTLVALRPDGGVVLVALNTGNESIALTVNDGNETFTHGLKEKSIQTYLYY